MGTERNLMQSEIDELRQMIASLPTRLAPVSGTGDNRKRAELTTEFDQGDWDTITEATATIYAPLSAAAELAWEDTEEEITVYDNGFVPEDGLDAGTKIQVVRINGQWWYDGGC